MLHKLRNVEQRMLDPIAARMSTVNPNTITMLSVLVGILSSVLLLLPGYWLLVAAACIIISGLFDLLDGVLARKFKKVTKLGDFLDWVGDRYVDFLIIIGLTYSPYVANRELGIFAISGVFLVSFVGSRVEVSGAKPVEGGMMARADRMFIIVLALIVQFILINTVASPFLFGLSLFEYVLLFLAVFGHLTAVYRVTAGALAIKRLKK